MGMRFRVSATLARAAGMTRVLPHTMSVGFLDTSSTIPHTLYSRISPSGKPHLLLKNCMRGQSTFLRRASLSVQTTVDRVALRMSSFLGEPKVTTLALYSWLWRRTAINELAEANDTTQASRSSVKITFDKLVFDGVVVVVWPRTA